MDARHRGPQERRDRRQARSQTATRECDFSPGKNVFSVVFLFESVLVF
jgi:hypothetical protein